jgi:hypothetical protein
MASAGLSLPEWKVYWRESSQGGTREREKFPWKKSPNFQLYFVLGFSQKFLVDH